MLKKIILFIVLFTVAGGSSAYAYSPAAEWKEYRAEHFIVHYHPNIPAKYVRQFTKRCEYYYQAIAERLGFRRFDFWSWEKRARIFIYQSRQAYVRDRGRPEWSAASAEVRKKIISTYWIGKDNFDIILPHELTHIILREYIGLDASVPLWFEEGLACANEEGCLEYLSSPKETFEEAFYSTAASAVIFLLEDYGRDDFVCLCRRLRDGDTFYQAMDKVYGIKGAEDLNTRFLVFLEKEDGNYGCQREFCKKIWPGYFKN